MSGLPPLKSPPKNLPPLPDALASPLGSPRDRKNSAADAWPSPDSPADLTAEEIVEERIEEEEMPMQVMQSSSPDRSSPSGALVRQGAELAQRSPSKRFRRGIDAEGLVLHLTPQGLVDQLLGEPDGLNATDRWGWTALHKAAIYGKADHIIALLDAGADPSLLTEGDPTQLYKDEANALELAQCVDHEGWGDRIPIIQMLETALQGRWKETRTEAERKKLKYQEEVRLRGEQLERDIQMVAKGEALMRMKQRQEMEENLVAMAEAERRRDEAVEREARAEELLAGATEARDEAQMKQADAEATHFALQARLTASRREGEDHASRILELERKLGEALEEGRALREEMEERDRQHKERADAVAVKYEAVFEALNADVAVAQAATDELKEQLANRVRLHRLETQRAEEAESKTPPLIARAERAEAQIPPLVDEIQGLKAEQERLHESMGALERALAQEQADKADALAKLAQEIAAKEEVERQLALEILAHEEDVVRLQGLLAESKAETLVCQQTIAVLEKNLAATKESLEDERLNLARALKEFAEQMEDLKATHAEQVAGFTAEISKQQAEKEVVSQQLVGKIRQLKTDRDLREEAESRIPPLLEEIHVLTEIKLAQANQIAELEPALEAERVTVSGLETDLAAEQTEKAEWISEHTSEVEAHGATKSRIPPLVEEIDRLSKDNARVQEDWSRKYAVVEGDLVATKDTLEVERVESATKQAEWTTVREQLEADLEAEKKEKDMVSQQLVSKIRQLKGERERVVLAEGKIAALAEEIEALYFKQERLNLRIGELEPALAAEQVKVSSLEKDLAVATADKADVCAKLTVEVNARAAAEAQIPALVEDIDGLKAVVAQRDERIVVLEAEVASVRASLQEQVGLLGQKEATWNSEREALIGEYEVRLRALELDLETQKQGKEVISQQLVSKIRQLKTERARADAAESKLPPLELEVTVLKVNNGRLEKKVTRLNGSLEEEKAHVRELWSQLHEQSNKGEYLKEKLFAEKFVRKVAEKRLKPLKAEVVEKQARIEEVEGMIPGLEGRIAELEAYRVAMEAEAVAEKERGVAEMQAVMAEHASAVGVLEGAIAHQNKEKEVISQQLVSKIRQLKAMRERAEEAESKISGIHGLQWQVDQLQNKNAELTASLVDLQLQLAAERAKVSVLRVDLAAEQAEKEEWTAKHASEVEAHGATKSRIPPLVDEIRELKVVVAVREQQIEGLEAKARALEAALVVEKERAEAQLAELLLAAQQAREAHVEAVELLGGKIECHRKQTETVSQQLVSKIRQLKQERARAEEAEAQIPPLVAALASMTSKFEVTAMELEITASELDACKKRLAKLLLALDEERRCSSELRETNISSEARGDRFESLSEELAARIPPLEAALAEAFAAIPPLEARIGQLEAELEALREEYEAFKLEAVRLMAEIKAKLAASLLELEQKNLILETKDEHGRTLLERLAASEERERMDAMRIKILMTQKTAMVGIYSDKDLMNTPPASPLDSPARTPTRTPRRGIDA